ncbi:sigma-70 family RNA polymerase sigma factor [Desulfuromonas sp. KJ2020]|uniref:RNA polymerase sigma factor n=1 Tax=Desulfuromonas sp. KJ2020 TaxID=2919173 RepID=UPI0020A82D60|nr:sigma-70 family RNA polymerase sigma factor [Desulfuromonas sp. KJ2020]MCP3176069.1 sigma-70 family RNA polymerase sigma factor [Desulfuromonas sp. KJ2020]
MDEGTEKIILEQILQGNDRAFEQLVQGHAAQILSLATRLIGDRDEAEDIAQEAFLRLHRSLGTFRGDSKISTWLYRTVSRLAIDHLRREQRRRKLFFFRKSDDEEQPDPVESAAAPDPSPREALLAQETQRRLNTVLKKLSPRQRAVFILRHQEELPLKEIARILELEEGTVKAHLHRAVTVLRHELHDLKEGSP